jgi:glycine/D-amino acid oxidase-like deaminating enzyme
VRDLMLPNSAGERYDVIIVGAGAAGAVCAGMLTARGVHVLLISETIDPSHQIRSAPLEDHLARAYQPMSLGATGGYWAQVVRELNLPVRAHVAPPIAVTTRGTRERRRLPVVLSATELVSVLVRLTSVPLEVLDYATIERVLQAGLLVPWHQLCEMHDVKLEDWFDENDADPYTRHVVEKLVAVLAGTPTPLIGQEFSVFGAFAYVRTLLAAEGAPTLIEPDVRRGLIEPLVHYLKARGGSLWHTSRAESVIVREGAVCGVQMADGRMATAPHIALAVDNARIPSLFDRLPTELIEPLRNETQFPPAPRLITTLLTRRVVDSTDRLIIHDPSTGANTWLLPASAAGAELNGTDAGQVCLQWSGDATVDDDATVSYLDDVCEDEFPGWKRAIGSRANVARRRDWLSTCLVGPKVPRCSPSIRGLWYVGESTEPVRGIATEQAAFAGYDGALAIAVACAEPGRSADYFNRPLVTPADMHGSDR